MLSLNRFSVSVDNQKIVNHISLQVKPREIHTIMGPNGSGKSTLAYALTGHPQYHISSGSKATLNRINLLSLTPNERAQAGLFLAFQYPVSLSGVSVQNFLKTAYESTQCTQCSKGKHLNNCAHMSVRDFRDLLYQEAGKLEIDPKLLSRSLNEGFSGGEKKRIEILQMVILKPKFAILDETDSGLDIDSIKTIAKGIQHAVKQNHTGTILITHYRRILDYLKIDKVHVMIKGQIVKSDGPKLIHQIETSGYKPFKAKK